MQAGGGISVWERRLRVRIMCVYGMFEQLSDDEERLMLNGGGGWGIKCLEKALNLLGASVRAG